MSQPGIQNPSLNGPTEACLVERRPELFEMLCRMGFSEGDAEDASQEAIITGLSYLANGKALDLKDRRAWLRTVAVRAAMKAARRSLKTDPAAGSKLSVGPGDDIYRDEVIAAIRQAIQTLPECLRQLVTFVALEGHSCREAGHRFGVHPGGVSRRMQQAYEMIRAHLVARGFGDEAHTQILRPARSA